MTFLVWKIPQEILLQMIWTLCEIYMMDIWRQSESQRSKISICQECSGLSSDSQKNADTAHTGVSIIIRAKSQQWETCRVLLDRGASKWLLTMRTIIRWSPNIRTRSWCCVKFKSFCGTQRKQLKFYIYCFYLIGIVALYNTDDKTIKWLCPFLKIRFNVFLRTWSFLASWVLL